MMPTFLFRRATIVKHLTQCGAVSEDSAKTLEEAGVPNPTACPKITEDLVKQGKLGLTKDNKYCVK